MNFVPLKTAELTLPSKSDVRVPFNVPTLAGNELRYVAEAIGNNHLSGDGPFTARCHSWLEAATGCHKALLTHSCTAALEMAAMLLNLTSEDEVIMPSFTFVSTANAVVLRGATPVFVDVRPDTLNIDEDLIERAITKNTRAIFVVHYAGVACEMQRIMEIAARHDIAVVEDAAQGILATYRDQPLGAIGHLGCFSFHETKNVISGEGGALAINDPILVERAQILREKGTNRSAFFQGLVDKYTWVDYGSSYLPSEITAAFLLGQLESAESLQRKRSKIWARYHEDLAALEFSGHLRRPIVPPDCGTNNHIYYVLMRSPEARLRVLAECKIAGVGATFHYIPLHSSPAGKRFGRTHGTLSVTDDLSARLVRLPLWPGMSEAEVEAVIEVVERATQES
jgi:dTDP-4-amino-4,6-dideoxygalactose transaminase